MKFIKFLKNFWEIIFVFIFAFLIGFLILNGIDNQFSDIKSICSEKTIIHKYVFLPSKGYLDLDTGLIQIDATYLKFDETLKEIASREYNKETYNCTDFSQDLQLKLREMGIEAKLVRGEVGGRKHMWISIGIEATTGQFIKPNSRYVEYKEN